MFMFRGILKLNFTSNEENETRDYWRALARDIPLANYRGALFVATGEDNVGVLPARKTA
jgi:hypothetical protein